MTGIFRERAYFSTRAFARRRRYASVTSRRASRASADHFTCTPGIDSSASTPPSWVAIASTASFEMIWNLSAAALHTGHVTTGFGPLTGYTQTEQIAVAG